MEEDVNELNNPSESSEELNNGELDANDLESVSGGVEGTSGVIRAAGVSIAPPLPPGVTG